MSIAELPNNRPRDPNINSVGAEFERTPPQDQGDGECYAQACACMSESDRVCARACVRVHVWVHVRIIRTEHVGIAMYIRARAHACAHAQRSILQPSITCCNTSTTTCSEGSQRDMVSPLLPE